MHPGLIGALVGIIIGLAGGIIGTYFSIKNTSTKKEKNFMVRGAVYFWIAGIIFILLLLILPMPYNFLLWIPYGIGLPLGIMYVNKKQAAIKKENQISENI